MSQDTPLIAALSGKLFWKAVCILQMERVSSVYFTQSLRLQMGGLQSLSWEKRMLKTGKSKLQDLIELLKGFSVSQFVIFMNNDSLCFFLNSKLFLTRSSLLMRNVAAFCFLIGWYSPISLFPRDMSSEISHWTSKEKST